MSNPLYGIDPEPLASLNGRAHPGGGTATVEMPSGEGLVEDGFQAQLRAMEIAYREPVARHLVQLAELLEHTGTKKSTAAIDELLEKWAGGTLAPGFVGEKGAPPSTDQALNSNLQLMKQIVEQNISIGKWSFYRPAMRKLLRDIDAMINLISSGKLEDASTYGVQGLDYTIGENDLNDVLSNSPADAINFRSSWQHAKDALKQTMASKQLKREEKPAQGTLTEQQAFKSLWAKYQRAAGLGKKMDVDLAAFRLSMRDPQHLAILNRHIDAMMKQNLPLYNQWDKYEEQMTALSEAGVADHVQSEHFGAYFDEVANSIEVLLSTISIEAQRLR